MKEKSEIIIGKKKISFLHLKKLIYNYACHFQKNEMEIINLKNDSSIHFVASLIGALQSKCTINIYDEKEVGEENLFNSFFETNNELVSINDDFKFDIEEPSFKLALKYKNKSMTYIDLKEALIKSNKVFSKKDRIFLLESKDLYSLCFGILFPFYLNKSILINSNVEHTLKTFKPSILVGEKNSLRELYNTYFRKKMNFFNEWLYHSMRSWDVNCADVYLNRNLFFKEIKCVKKLILNDYKDVQNFWNDLHSNGIDIYSADSFFKNLK